MEGHIENLYEEIKKMKDFINTEVIEAKIMIDKSVQT